MREMGSGMSIDLLRSGAGRAAWLVLFSRREKVSGISSGSAPQPGAVHPESKGQKKRGRESFLGRRGAGRARRLG
jgi:hypothetical protein